MNDYKSKIFTNKTISIATFFGGPISAGLLISKNYVAFGNKKAATNSIFLGIISTFLIFTTIIIIPDESFERIPQSFIPLVYTAIIALLVQKLQGKRIDEHIANNGEKASYWTAVGYGLLGTAISLIFLFAIAFSSPFEGYEKKIDVDQNITLYYNKKIEQNYSNHLSKVIKTSGFLEGAENADLFLSETADAFILKFIVTGSEVLSDEELISDFKYFEQYLNNNIQGEKRIKIGFTDIYLKNNYEMPEIAIEKNTIYEPLQYLQYHKVNNNHTIYYNANTEISDIKKVEDSIKRLKSYFPENAVIDIIFLRNENDYTIKFFVVKELWNNPTVIEKLKSTVEYITNNGIDKKIRLVLIDNKEFEEREI